METGLRGRVGVISGGSQGIGRATALALAKEGVNLALCARGCDGLHATAAEARRVADVQVYEEALDVRDSDAIRNFVANVVQRFGRLDVCVANAGGPPAKAFAHTSDEDWQSAFEMNLRSTIVFAQEVLPIMERQRWGRFIALTSVSVKQPLPGLALSNTIRAGVTGLIRTLSNEYACYGITINNVAPGYTATTRLGELSKKVAGQSGTSQTEVEQGWTKEVPAGRLAQPEEIAAAIVWLASEGAGYITGQTLVVDGGLYKGV